MIPFHPTQAEKPLISASDSPNPASGAVILDWPRLIGAGKKKKQQILNVKVRRSVSCPEREPRMFSGAQHVTGILRDQEPVQVGGVRNAKSAVDSAQKKCQERGRE